MLNTAYLGLITLNISFVLYMIYYVPQLYHNAQSRNLKALSLHFHILLLLSYLSDLLYGFGMQMPWQYRLVDIIGLGCLLYQHYQLWQLRNNQQYFRMLTHVLWALLLTSLIIIIWQPFSRDDYLVLGLFAQISGIVHSLPQLWRNFRLSSATSLSLIYLLINSGCVLCDNVSAWTLHWPLPNKLGCAIRAILLLGLLVQYYHYQFSQYKSRLGRFVV